MLTKITKETTTEKSADAEKTEQKRENPTGNVCSNKHAATLNLAMLPYFIK